MRARSPANWAGHLPSTSNTACATPSSGISITRPGSRMCAAAPISRGSSRTTRRESRNERHHSRRRLRNAPLSGHARRFKAAFARLRQADDLLPAEHSHARRAARHPHHLNARRHAQVCRTARRRKALGHQSQLCRAAQPRRPRAGLHHRPRFHRQRYVLPHSRRQYLLRPVVFARSAARGQAKKRRAGLRIPRARSGTLRRSGVRRRGQGDQH